MFELPETMRQQESKLFAELLNRLREGKHTAADIAKLKESYTRRHQQPNRCTSPIYTEC